MSDVGLDVRTPMGAMFTLLGAVLVVYGIASDKAVYDASLGININLWWGLVIFGFGLIMLLLAWRGRERRAQARGFDPVLDETRPPH